MSRTGTAVEKRKFFKIPNWRQYLLKKRKSNWQNHWEWLNKPFRNASKPWEWFRSNEIGFRTSWSREMLNGVSLLEKSCFKDRIENGFYIALWPATGDEKWVYYDNPKCRKSWGMLGHACTLSARPNIHGAKVMLCIWWNQLGVVYYELLKPSETITGNRYRKQLMRLSRALKKKRPQYHERRRYVKLT